MSAKLDEIALFYDTGMGNRPISAEELKEGTYNLTIIGDDERKYKLDMINITKGQLSKRLIGLLRNINVTYHAREIVFSPITRSCEISGSTRRGD